MSPSSHDSNRLDSELLDRYLAGECSASEREQVMRLLGEGTPEAFLAGTLAAVASGVEHSSVAFTDPAHIVQRLKAERGAGHFVGDVPQRARGFKGWPGGGGAPLLRGWLGGTAIVAVMSLAIVRTHMTTSRNHTVAQTYTTDSSHQLKIRLVDGSSVVLGPATTLSVTTNTMSLSARVVLIGQAQFVVQHRRAIPFTIHIPTADIRVLGTAFFVRNYATDKVACVLVTDGRIALQPQSFNRGGERPSVIIPAGTFGVIDDSGQVRTTTGMTADESVIWRTGRLVFRDTPVSEVVTTLGRAYGVKMQVAPSAFAGRSLTWAVPVGRYSLTEVLELLGDVLDAHYTEYDRESERIITLVPGHAPSAVPSRHFIPLSQERDYGR